MRIRKIILSITLVWFGISNGQSTLSSPSNNNVTLPNFTPPSPKSFEYTKYGDIPVNEFTGLMNYNIPLYEYKAGKLNLPISLDYISSGVKIDQSNTWTGINWTLRTGGLISRTINDLADEMYGQSNRVSLNAIPLNSGADGSQEANNIVNIIENNTYDSEADIFNFNFNGYSGSFFLDNNFEPTLVNNNSEIKISIVGSLQNSQEFSIITPDGSKYFFGGSNAIETEAGTSTNPCSSCGRATSYYLTKIIHPINGTILFDYDTVSSINYITKSRNYGVLTHTTFFNTDGCFFTPPPPETTEEILLTTRQTSTKFLKKIYSPDNPISINFISINKNLGNSIKILNKIEVKKNTEVIKELDFEYLGSNQNNSIYKRFFLTKLIINKNICINNNLQNKLEEYSMEYDDAESLPDRFSFAQDYYGYYNGIHNNISSLPKVNINLFNIANYNYYAANRKPNFDYARKGTLKKIIYPTKGFTEFEYEGIPVKEKIYLNHSGHASLSTSGPDYSNNSVPRFNTETESWININPIYENQLVNITVNLTNDESCALPNHNLKTKLIIEDLTTPNIQPTVFEQNLGYQGGSLSYPYYFYAGKTYKIRVEFINTISYCSNSPLNVNFSFSLFAGYQIKDGMGIRVKRIIDKPDSNSSVNIKRYYYVPYNKVPTYLNPINVPFETIPSLVTYGMLNFRAQHRERDGSDEGHCVFNWWTDQAYYAYINSNAIKNSFSATDRFVYPIVTISYGGDNFENGGTQKIFKKIDSETGIILNSLSTPQYPTEIITNRFQNKLNNEVVLSGNLIQQIDFEKRENNFYKKKQIDYYYYDSNLYPNKYYVNIIGKKVYEVMDFYNGVNDPMKISSNYHIKSFLTKSFNTKLNSIKESNYTGDCIMPNYDFIDILPEDYQSLADYQDPLNSQKIITTKEFTYGSLKGLPIETKNYSSEGSQLITKNYYPNQISTLSNVTENEITANNKLVSQNRIATPIQVEQYRNGDLLSTQRNVNKSWNNNPELILPEKILSSTGTQPLEERVIFSEYDAKGNPSIFSLKDGSKTKYYYNNINQVILKVENYTTSLNIPDVPNLSDACGFINQYPSAQITVFNYDSITNQITSIVYPNCMTSYYEYDSLHNLKLIKDSNGKIIQEFDHNYKPQN